MESNTRQRPALGQIATTGTFYNASKETFVPLSLLKASMLRRVIITENAHHTSTRLTFDTSCIRIKASRIQR